MRHSNHLAIGAAGFVLLGVASLAFLLTQISNRRVSLGAHPTYKVTAMFDNIGDLKVGARVSIAGIEMGRVMAIGFDSAQQRAVVSMRLSTEFNQIPNDSSASINTRGVLGGKFISLQGGGSRVYLKNEDQIAHTRSAVPLENMIGQLVAHYLRAKGEAADHAPPPSDRK